MLRTFRHAKKEGADDLWGGSDSFFQLLWFSVTYLPAVYDKLSLNLLGVPLETSLSCQLGWERRNFSLGSFCSPTVGISAPVQSGIRIPNCFSWNFRRRKSVFLGLLGCWSQIFMCIYKCTRYVGCLWVCSSAGCSPPQSFLFAMSGWNVWVFLCRPFEHACIFNRKEANGIVSG